METTFNNDSVQDEQFGHPGRVPENMKNPTDNSDMAENSSLSGDVDNTSQKPVDAENSTKKKGQTEVPNDNTILENQQDPLLAETDEADPQPGNENVSEPLVSEVAPEKDTEQTEPSSNDSPDLTPKIAAAENPASESPEEKDHIQDETIIAESVNVPESETLLPDNESKGKLADDKSVNDIQETTEKKSEIKKDTEAKEVEDEDNKEDVDDISIKEVQKTAEKESEIKKDTEAKEVEDTDEKEDADELGITEIQKTAEGKSEIKKDTEANEVEDEDNKEDADDISIKEVQKTAEKESEDKKDTEAKEVEDKDNKEDADDISIKEVQKTAEGKSEDKKDAGAKEVEDKDNKEDVDDISIKEVQKTAEKESEIKKDAEAKEVEDTDEKEDADELGITEIQKTAEGKSEDKKDAGAKEVEDKDDKEDADDISMKEVQKAVEEKSEDKKDTEAKEKEAEDKDDKEDADDISVKEVDYSTFAIDELLNTLSILVSDRPVQEIRNDVESIKINFYKKHKIEVDKKKKAFLAEGGDIIDFMPGEDPRENQIKDLLARYRNQKSAYNKDLEFQKTRNLQEKYQIIEEIKDLVNRKESINKTFQEFRDLQTQWREVGVVPQQNLKDLWETYHHHVEKFYDYIKINKELRDLDLRKNQELKIKLCERAEVLILEPSVVNAFKMLQKLHEQWREIGPVPHEVKSELWERFREATSKINKKHQEFYEDLKSTQKKNLEAKTHLCDKVEEINNQTITSHKEWDKKSIEIIEVQKIWRTIGYAPKKSNNKIYQRFREVCDDFFKKKREFYAENKEIQNNNLQQKIELCIEAEALQDSTEWKKTTEDLIQLQKKWKEIGPGPRKQSEKTWKRFRAACDTFFQKKSEYYSQIDTTYEDNLKLKKNLIDEIQKFSPVENMEENFNQLKEFQRKWTEIGYVPFKQKDEILQEYRIAINKAFDSLKVDESQKNILKYRNKLANIRENPKAEMKIKQDREKFLNKIKQLESDIVLWENNIGFFAKSKNADSMIKEVHEKIDRAKSSIILLEEKIELIDQADDE